MMNGPFDNVRTVEVAGTSLGYLEQGSGEPVVLVHGTASDLRMWKHQLPDLSAHHRVIAYSRRFSPPNPEPIADGADDPMLRHVEDLAAFLPAVDAVPAHLVGHSWGGFIALLTAIRHPELVKSLVLMEPPVLSLYVSTPPRPLEMLKLFLSRPRTAAAILTFGAGAFGPAQQAFRDGRDDIAMRIFGTGIMGEEYFARVTPEEMEEVRENTKTAKAQLLGEGFPPLQEDEVRTVEAPTLLVHGQHSPAFLQRLTDRLEELLPHAQRVEIADASHRMTADNPEQVNRELVRFLAA